MIYEQNNLPITVRASLLFGLLVKSFDSLNEEYVVCVFCHTSFAEALFRR